MSFADDTDHGNTSAGTIGGSSCPKAPGTDSAGQGAEADSEEVKSREDGSDGRDSARPEGAKDSSPLGGPTADSTDDCFEVTAVAHRLNNLLFTICGLARIVRDAEQETQTKEDLSAIMTQSQRASELVESLLRASKRRNHFTEPVDVNAALRRIIENQEPALQMSEVDLRSSLHPDAAPVPGVPEQIEQVFECVVENARMSLEEVPPPRILKVESRSRKECVCVCFSDNGPGIDPDVLPFVFEPFFTTRADGLGNGLGLAVSRRIVSDLGGDIEISSRRGRGTSVSVRLPVSASPGKKVSFPDKFRSQHSPLRSTYRKRTTGGGKCVPWR